MEMDAPREYTSFDIRMEDQLAKIVLADKFYPMFVEDIRGTYGADEPEAEYSTPGPFSYYTYIQHMEVSFSSDPLF